MKAILSVLFFLTFYTQDTFSLQLSNAALSLTKDHVVYDGSYRQIPYPNGDVPKNIGVCTDVVIRAYRKLGIDLQKEVHEDMKANFSKYPKTWGLKSTDTNIDHRRVPNLQVFFTRKGTSLPVTKNADDYKPGDLVTWMLTPSLPHIGIVVNRKSADGKRYMIVHNIGRGQELEDCLFNYNISGHYRYNPTK
ncbi:DUF1287 domain-containing protein [Flavobacterium suaedae]|uniref:DUF1287 domain-containing protein n=1 Tax=Flavobacterium suaedae TaxID=1767027 RepID=A0ABQ1JPD9_9FLAO|nr:DUF1287 domain-containing protein [Flavobacterium suaedae]GGB71357.1 DUF1287 domain-containing protein [Flavobacterium suaedae]